VNGIGNIGITDLGENLSQCNKLKTISLFLYYNHVNGEGILGLSSQLIKCKNLTSLFLDFQFNRIDDKSASDLGSILKQNTKITYLEILLMGYYLTEVSQQILKNKLNKIRRLVVNSNNF
ncbi:hypothetical protein ABPG73_006782, partial [Tetrahymena malaccensis]